MAVPWNKDAYKYSYELELVIKRLREQIKDLEEELQRERSKNRRV